MLDQTGLRERRGDQIGTLSGGNQQRVNIAIGLLSAPAVLLLDEPSTGLDPRQRERLWEFVLGLAGQGTTVIFTTHHLVEAERYGNRLLVLADGEDVFDGTAQSLHAAVPDAGGRDFEAAFVAFLRERGTRPGLFEIPTGTCCFRDKVAQDLMRWLLIKDLQILRRSPLVTALLVGYPVIIGILIGFALSGDEGKPRVAFLNEVDGGRELRPRRRRGRVRRRARRASQLCDRVECVDVDSREEAEEMVRDGEVLGALILPEDLLDRLQSLTSLNPEQPTVEVLVNEDDPVKAQLVDDRISALITEANLLLSQRISEQAAALHRPPDRGRHVHPAVPRRLDRDPGPPGRERDPDLGRGGAAARRGARRARAGDRRSRRRPRRTWSSRCRCWAPSSSPIAVEKEVVSGGSTSLERVHDLDRRDRDADVRDRAAGRRLARARARGERVHPHHARLGRPRRASWSRSWRSASSPRSP